MQGSKHVAVGNLELVPILEVEVEASEQVWPTRFITPDCTIFYDIVAGSPWNFLTVYLATAQTYENGRIVQGKRVQGRQDV